MFLSFGISYKSNTYIRSINAKRSIEIFQKKLVEFIKSAIGNGVPDDLWSVYYYTYQDQAPGNYGISNWDSCGNPPVSVAVYVFENNVVTPTPNPTYYFTSYTTPSVTAQTGNQIYICEIGSRTTLFSESWAQ